MNGIFDFDETLSIDQAQYSKICYVVFEIIRTFLGLKLKNPSKIHNEIIHKSTILYTSLQCFTQVYNAIHTELQTLLGAVFEAGRIRLTFLS